jgi:hypothetical protein
MVFKSAGKALTTLVVSDRHPKSGLKSLYTFALPFLETQINRIEVASRNPASQADQ